MAIKNINTDLQIEAGLRDGDGDLGTNNQVLISTGTGINWIDGSGTGIIGGPYLPLAGGTMTGTNGVLVPDNFKLKFGDTTTPDLQIYHDGSNSYIDEAGQGSLYNRSTLFIVQNIDSTKNSIIGSPNAAVKLYYNGVLKLETTNTGASVTGELEATTLDINGNADISGIISGNFVVRSTNNSNADGANFAVDTTNKDSTEYAYEVLRSGTTVAGITTVGKITGTELEGTSLDINGNGDVSGNLTINGGVIANGGITGLDIAGGISGNNYNISGVNQLSINDPGEGIVFSGTTNVQLFTIDDATDSILKITSATALDVNAKITNLSPGSANLDAVNYQQLTDAVAGVLVYQGTWNASTNTPALASGVGTPGYYYIVSTPGSTNLDGITDWNTGDWVIFSDQATDAWQKIDHTNVLNGAGTGNQVTKWSGAGTSYTLADSSITDNGTSVGIGTTLPGAAYKLEVNGLLKANGGYFTNPVSIFDNTATENPRLSLGRSSGETLNFDVEDRTAIIYHKQDETSGIHKLSLSVDSDSVDTNTIDFNFRNSAGTATTSTPMTILSSGRVGIGTDSPSGVLEVAENGGGTWTPTNKPTLFVSNAGTSNGYYTFGIRSNSGDIFAVTNAGNVGIGTTSLNAKLQIEGTASTNKLLLIKNTDTGGNGPALAIEGIGAASSIIDLNRGVAGRVAGTIYATAGTTDFFSGLYYNGGASQSNFGIGTDKDITNQKFVITSTGNVGIGTTSPAASLDIVKTSLPTTGKSYGVRLDMEKDSSTTAYTVSAFGLRSYVKSVNTGTNQITDVNGLWSKAEHTGTGPTYFLIGSTNRGVHNGSGNTGVVYGNFAEASIIGTGVGTHPYLVGGYSKTILNNINATLTNSVGHYIKTDVAAGAVTSVSGLIIDLDMTGGSVTGDLAYLKIQNDTITTTVGGTSRAINSLSALPSVFAGNMGIGTTNPSTKLHVEATTSPQVRIGYDANNYVQVSVSGTGDATIAPTGNGIIAPDLTLSAGSAYIKVDAQTNNVGIKTTNPRTALEVLGTVRVWSGANTHTYVETSSGSNLGSIQGKKNSDSTVKALALNPLGGNIGINLGAGVLPGRQLTLSGNSSPIISLKSNTTGGEPSIYFGDTTSDAVGRIVYSNSQDYISLWTAASERVRVTNAGDTGIGVTTPRAKLDVNGGVKVADDADTAALNKVGTLRYRYVPGSPKNFSYVDMCMQTGTNSYDWVNIVQNVWN